MKTIKKVLNFLAKKHILSIVATALVMVIIYHYVVQNFCLPTFTENVIINIFSGWIAALSVVLLYWLERAIKNRCEDSEKLSDDYDQLVKMYSKDQLITAEGPNETIKFPVVLLGEVADLPVTEKAIHILDDPQNMYNIPEMLQNHFEEILEAHGTSSIYNARNVRVLDMHLDANGFYLETGRTTYFNSLLTNRAMDWSWGGTTTRMLYEYGPKLSALRESKLSNHLGFNGFVESMDGKILFIKRKNNVSIGKFTYGDSIGASMKTKYALDEEGFLSVSGLQRAILKEIEDELKIKPDHVCKDRLRIIAAYRDCIEGGKPQFLFYAVTDLNASEIEENFRKNDILSEIQVLCKSFFKDGFSGIKKEYDRYSTVTDGSLFAWVKHYDIEAGRVQVHPDGMDASVIQKGRNKILHMKMVPSASACVVLLQQYLNLKQQYNMEIIDESCQGKHGDADCEDGLIKTKNIVAVIDGVTAKGSRLWDGKSSGCFARDVIMACVQQLDQEDMNAGEFFDYIDKTLAARIESENASNKDIDVRDYPRASVVLYNARRHQVWNYGDCRCKIGGVLYEHRKLVDEINSRMRGMIDEAALMSGSSEKNLQKSDEGRAAIERGLVVQSVFENQEHPLGYPVLNGCGINPDMIKIYPVQPGQTVILATDGYPQICDTLEETEALLKQTLKNDPLCIRVNPSTKGVMSGNDSYDDRTYCRIKV